MQWFIRTTEDLRERIEQIYRLESALARLDTLAANIDNISQQLEKDLRPSKVQHEMRLRALEPLLEQIEDQERFKAELLKLLEDSAAEIKSLRQEYTALKKISTTKNEKQFEQFTADIAALRSDLNSLKEELSAPKEDQSAEQIAALQSELDALKEKLSEPKEDQSAEEIAALRSELDALKEQLSEPKEDQSAEQIAALRSELDALKEKLSEPKEGQSAEQIVALQSELDALKEKLSEPKEDQSAEEIAALRSELDALKEQLSEPKEDQSAEEIKKLRAEFQSNSSAKDEEIKQLWQLFDERIASKDAEIKQLREQATELTSRLEDRGNAITEIIRQVEHLWKKIDGLEDKLEKQEAPQPKAKRKTVEKASKEPIDSEPKILQFEIESSGVVYLSGTPDEITTKLKAAMNVEELQTFLEGSKAANKVIFLRSLDRHVRNLQKLTYKLNFDEYGDNQASEEITKKFFEIFKLTLLESVASTSYRGLTRQPEFYREFLTHFNRYLQRCGIYTRRVLPNGRLTEQDRLDMKINRRETINAANDDLIVEVERLPYYIDYLSADGETKNLFFEGKMIAYGLKGNS